MRIRGKVGQADENSPEDVRGKWFFEMWMSPIGGGEGDSLGVFGPWETEAIAGQELRTACQLACDAIEEKLVGKKSGAYIDMKTNVTRRWDKSDEH